MQKEVSRSKFAGGVQRGRIGINIDNSKGSPSALSVFFLRQVSDWHIRKECLVCISDLHIEHAYPTGIPEVYI